MTNDSNVASTSSWQYQGPQYSVGANQTGARVVGTAFVGGPLEQSTAQPFQIDTYQASRKSFLTPCVRGAVSTVLGLAVTGVTTWVLVESVRRAIIHQKAPGNAQSWIATGRGMYDDCYNGCNDCDNTKFALNACGATAKAKVEGVICDGAAMWNWLNRYPEACMLMLGEAAALASAKQKDRNDLAMIILTVAAGLVVGVASYKLLGCVASRAGASRGAQV